MSWQCPKQCSVMQEMIAGMVPARHARWSSVLSIDARCVSWGLLVLLLLLEQECCSALQSALQMEAGLLQIKSHEASQ